MRGRKLGYFSAIFGCFVLPSACSNHAALAAIPEASERLVETPSGLAVLSQSQSRAGLPEDVTFGDASGRSALYLQFPPEWRARGVPLKGFLVLEPRSGEMPDPEPVPVEIWRVRSRWEPENLRAWSDKPELAPPYVSAVVSSSPARTLRVDITELLRFAANNPDLDQGLALIARAGDGHGATFTTGMSGGAAPRLEVYMR